MATSTDVNGTTEHDPRPDLYIGLVCPAGTDLTEVKNQLQAQLSVVDYGYKEIKVSRVIDDLIGVGTSEDEYVRVRKLMRAGDALREASENGEGVASGIVTAIRSLRGESSGPSTTAYVIDSLKNPAETSLLDHIYGRNYYTISVYLPKNERISNLRNKIAKGRHEPPGDGQEQLAKNLIAEDEKGAGKKSQNVRDCFPRADFFINATGNVADQVKRFIELVFREPFTTPTPDEYYMFLARASALRSCDLSRQVGAVIVDACGSIVSTGCNEVPYPGGGIYFEGRKGPITDNRDYKKGHDPNYIEIQRSLIEMIGVLREANEIRSNEPSEVIVDKLLHGKYREITSNARIRNLIEFGRVVHAEMHAITQAAATGRSVQEAVLYCTTYPCHGCARHIISSGIAEVVFIEPYPKSMTEQLYDEEIEVVHGPTERAPGTPEKVKFRPFQGVAPALYQRVFAYRDRKDDDGTIATWKPKAAEPVGAIYGIERPSVETAASNIVANVLEQAKTLYASKLGDIEHGSGSPLSPTP